MRVYEILPDTDIFYFKWVGEITLQDRYTNIDFILEECRKSGTNKVIVDGREQHTKSSLKDQYHFSRMVRRKFKEMKIAVLYEPSSTELEFVYALILRTSSLDLKRFKTIEQAVRWLNN